MNEIARKNEKVLEAEKKKAKQTKAKLNSDLKANEVKILELQNEIIELHLQLDLNLWKQLIMSTRIYRSCFLRRKNSFEV